MFSVTYQKIVYMGFKSSKISYKQTGAFSKIVTDYLAGDDRLKPFYKFQATSGGIKNAITDRKTFKTNRALLVDTLRKQYSKVNQQDAVNENINLLLDENSFVICTAHQPNIFTGHLYFIYKILHAIRLSADLEKEFPGMHFIPVYYMGSEDADLDELGEVSIGGKHYRWNTGQHGAVGRMTIDKAFIGMVDEIASQLSAEHFGPELIQMTRNAYVIGKTIEQATFEFVHELFAGYGLIIFLPDNPLLKKEFEEINRKELIEQFSHKLVDETISKFPGEYKVQVAGREINLFYMKEDSRERIYKDGPVYKVHNSTVEFSESEILTELENYPDRFSQNVILRPVFQQMILPCIAFIGGGGELAYWLELKTVFDSVSVPFPVLVLRNSFMIIPGKITAKINALKLSAADFFLPANAILESFVKREAGLPLQLETEKEALRKLYEQMGKTAGNIDVTLQKHTEALLQKAMNRVEILEKKMLKAAKRKFDIQQQQIRNIKETLYPSGVLQERVDNLFTFYAKWGKEFIQRLYENSTGLEQLFCILEETGLRD